MNIQFTHTFNLLDTICDTDILTDREIDALIDANHDAEWDLKAIEIEFTGDFDGEVFQVSYTDFSPLTEPLKKAGRIITSHPFLTMSKLVDLCKKEFDDFVNGDGLALIQDMAKEQDFQLWLEVCRDEPGMGLFIHDGEIVEESA